ncbi:MAG: glycerophosphodiester phosphodiesterase [Deltaproteobacteria bacterium]|nr:MAG: glycerophosphodiester phosphodiesterase [Deltaproteobacteria bacterium]
MSRAPLVIAHRGASAERPENTPSAYALAVEQRADMIEIDLHRTRDGEIVITHDAELEALGGRGEISKASLAEVRALDAGDGQRVPTLAEVLDGYGARIAFNLEIKRANGALYEGLEAQALEAVRARGLLPRTLFSSFYDPVLERLRGLAEDARIGLLISRRFPHECVARARALGAQALHPEAEVATPELIEAAHEAGLAVYVFTVDDPDAMRRFLELGVDGLFTNYPARLRALLGPCDAPV